MGSKNYMKMGIVWRSVSSSLSTLYQDAKTLLGRAERSKILKAWVRETIRRNEREQGISEGGQTAQ